VKVPVTVTHKQLRKFKLLQEAQGKKKRKIRWKGKRGYLKVAKH